MKRFLVTLLLFSFAAPCAAQRPSPTGLWGPRPSSVLYQTLIGFGDYREDKEVKIWSHDQNTVYIQIVSEGRIFRYIATDQGLKEVWSCMYKDRKLTQRPPTRTILSEDVEKMSFGPDQWHLLGGNEPVKVTVLLVPRWSEEGQDLIDGFNLLVRLYEIQEDTRK